MNTATTIRQSWNWGDWFNLALGIWLIISPFALGFVNTAAMWSNIAVGVVVILLALLSVSGNRAVQEVIVPLGVWLFMSPFILGFAGKALPANNIVVTFLMIAATASADAIHEAGLSVKSAYSEKSQVVAP